MNAPLSPDRQSPAAAISLDDKFTLERGRAFLTGTQALIRLTMLQRERDVLAGLNTAGYKAGIIYVITGAILLLAVTLDTIARRLQMRSGR